MNFQNPAKRDLLTLVIPFLTIVFCASAVDWIWPLARPYQPLSGPPRNQRHFRDGSLTKGFEDERQNRSRTAASCRPAWNELLYWTAREVPPQVVVGKDGWLFWRGANFHEFDDKTRAELGRNLDFVADVSDFLRERHVELIFLVSPDKARIYPEQCFKDDRMPEPAAGLYSWLMDQLKSRGIRTINLERSILALKAEHPDLLLYGTTDTHWLDFTIKAVAKELRDYIFAQKLLDPAGEVKDWDGRYAEVQWQDEDKPGNLATMVGVYKNGPAHKRFSFAQTLRYVADRKTGEGIETFGSSDVVMIGTSFTAEENYDLPQSFAMVLRRPVEWHSADATLTYRLMSDFIKDERNLADVKLMIWEVHLGI